MGTWEEHGGGRGHAGQDVDGSRAGWRWPGARDGGKASAAREMEGGRPAAACWEGGLRRHGVEEAQQISDFAVHCQVAWSIETMELKTEAAVIASAFDLATV